MLNYILWKFAGQNDVSFPNSELYSQSFRINNTGIIILITVQTVEMISDAMYS